MPKISHRDFLKTAAAGVGALSLGSLLEACGKELPERTPTPAPSPSASPSHPPALSDTLPAAVERYLWDYRRDYFYIMGTTR
jgi:hypothetical protein